MRSLFVVGLFAALSCGPQFDMRAYTAVDRQTNASAEDLYNAAIRVLLRRGYGFASRDSGASAMETKYLSVTVKGSGYSTSSYSYSWRVTTARGELSIFASCRNGPEYDQDCSHGSRPARVVDEQREIEKEILDDASK